MVFKQLRGVFLCIPLTSQGKHPVYHYKLNTSSNRESYLIFNQIRVLDKRRFVHKMKKISLDDFQTIKKLFHKVLFTKEPFGSETDQSPTKVGSGPVTSTSKMA